VLTSDWAKLGVDLIVILHLTFVLFVLFGGALLLRWRKFAWLHIPAVIWGILVELNGWLCPLTPLENHLREIAGLGLYEGDFVMHYLMPILYPVDLTRTTQIVFGLIVVFVNVAIYFYVFRIKSRRSIKP
jgi:hypothetical protein